MLKLPNYMINKELPISEESDIEVIATQSRLLWPEESMTRYIKDLSRILDSKPAVDTQEFQDLTLNLFNPENVRKKLEIPQSIITVKFTKEVFYRFMEVAMGEPYARSTMIHENEHEIFYLRNGATEVGYFAYMARKTNGGYFFLPFVKPVFPETMPTEEIKNLIRKSNRSVNDPSDGDKLYS